MGPPPCEAHNAHTSHTSALQPNGGTCTTAGLRSIYLDFLRGMCYDSSTVGCVPHNHNYVAEAVTALCGSHVDPAIVSTCADYALLVHKYYPLDIIVKIAHFAALGLTVDDMGQTLTGAAREVFLEDLSLFQMKMCDPERYADAYPGRGDLHPALEDFMHYLRSDQNPFFPAHPRTLSTFVKASIDFMVGSKAEMHYQDHPLKYTSEMRLFYRFFRCKIGFAEGMSCFIDLHTKNGTYTSPTMDDRLFYYKHVYPLVPELIEAFDAINDVLSFYKEMEDGDTSSNGILIRARLQKLSLLDALRAVSEEMVDQRNRVMLMVDESGSLEWKKTMKQFYQGYIDWHLGSKRYRLKEVLGDFGNTKSDLHSEYIRPDSKSALPVS